MSVRILQNKCVGCGKCLSVCPGNLLKKGEDGKVHIRNIRDCWGCTACLCACALPPAFRTFFRATLSLHYRALTHSLKIRPRSSKFLNIPQLAHAGESST